ncbi:MAG: hypothetical protein COA52_08590 [Hyphomicrobiales bacterium]|nr:MAG: hypothetical protein COA52_08590 [Hyphomicrobiales bacterium]
MDQLVKNQTTRKGTAADGVSQLILRAEVNEDVLVTFKLADSQDGVIEPLMEDKTVLHEAGFLSDEKHYAYALYTPAETFDVLQQGEVAPKSPLTPPEKRLDGHHLQIRDVKILIQSKDGNMVSKSLILARPPVVFVHGLFSDPVQTWIKAPPWQHFWSGLVSFRSWPIISAPMAPKPWRQGKRMRHLGCAAVPVPSKAILMLFGTVP